MNLAPCNHFSIRNVAAVVAGASLCAVLALPGQASAAVSYGALNTTRTASSHTLVKGLGGTLQARLPYGMSDFLVPLDEETATITEEEGSTVTLLPRDYPKYSKTVYGAVIAWRVVSWDVEMPDGSVKTLTPGDDGTASFIMPAGTVTVRANYTSPLAATILRVGEKTSFADLKSEIGAAEVISAILIRADDSIETVTNGTGATVVGKAVKDNYNEAGDRIESKDVTYTVCISSGALADNGMYFDINAFYRFNGVVTTLADYGEPNKTRPDVLPTKDADGNVVFTYTVNFTNPE